MRRIVHHFKFKKEKAGQSIVLLAIGFIALIAFVGLVTDLSLLFVRYSALRRAVDSSAIAAAGQIREGRDFGDIAIAARQYIELHGLEPHRVFVETCETDIAAWRAGTGEWEGSPHAEPEPIDNMPETELCQWSDPRKLVRVTAQIQSPTTFLRLVGWTDITLEATSVSETAVLDVALVLDSSETMSQETRYGAAGETFPSDSYIGQHAGREDWIRSECIIQSPDDGSFPDLARLQWAGCCSNPGEGLIRQDPSTGEWLIWTDVNHDDAYSGSAEDGIRPRDGRLRAVADNNYSDVICQPFKQVKDAARNFIRRLDFVRGDRVSLVTFAREAQYIRPLMAAPTSNDFMMTSEQQAMETLNHSVYPYFYQYYNSAIPNPYPIYFDRINKCPEAILAYWDANPEANFATDGHTSLGRVDPNNAADGTPKIPPFPTTQFPEIRQGTSLGDIMPGFPYNPPFNTSGGNLRHWSYESIAPCPDTNTGAGILFANNTLTNVNTIRKDAVWVIILLSDGNANATDKPKGEDTLQLPTYGAAGFCPWRTFCNGVPSNTGLPAHPECPAGNIDTSSPFCNDDTELTRHFCLVWSSTDPDLNGTMGTSPDCQQGGNYDADDYARDWADFAGLQKVVDGVEGNFIAMFTIGFGSFIADRSHVAGPLMHYIADAGDNGFIDDDFQEDLRDNGLIDGSVPVGDVGPCQGVTNYRSWCGQYYYAEDLRSLDAVFEAIASRLFTRISR